MSKRYCSLRVQRGLGGRASPVAAGLTQMRHPRQATVGVQHGRAVPAVSRTDIACGVHVTTVRLHMAARNAGPAPPIDAGHPNGSPRRAG